jgi:hypothetical protein
VGTGDSYEIRGDGLDGALEVLIRRPGGILPITRNGLARYREAELRGVTDPNRRRSMERWLAELEFPTTFPAYADLRRGGCDRKLRNDHLPIQSVRTLPA